MYYTASGIITPVGGRPVNRLREDCSRICALSWLITKIILRCTVSKTSKLLCRCNEICTRSRVNHQVSDLP